jgi:hypothetical protein
MKNIINLVGMALVAFLFFLLLVFVEENNVLNEIVVPRADVTLESWLESFRWWGTVGIFASLAAAVIWYIVSQFVFRVNDWRASGKRPIWALLSLIPIGASVAGIIFTQQAQNYAWVAYVFYVLNGLCSYYFATALFSPSSFKYTPVGAKKLRRWNMAF